MRYAVCPRCWLRMRDPENEEEAKDNCPRCLGRLGMQVPLYRTAGAARARSAVSDTSTSVTLSAPSTVERSVPSTMEQAAPS